MVYEYALNSNFGVSLAKFLMLFSMMVFPFFSILGKTHIRPSDYPWVTTTLFEEQCDYFYGRTSFNPEDIKDGDIIHCKCICIRTFFRNFHPRVKAKYILVYNGDDHPFSDRYLPFVNDPQLAFVFAQNNTIKNHPKVIPIPIGVHTGIFNRSYIYFNKLLANKPFQKNHLSYFNCETNNDPSRRKLFEHIKNVPYCKLQVNRISIEKYLSDISKSKFMFSPRGCGLDCYRTWESLIAGSIPIIEKSNLDPLYDDLPVLLVDNWDNINENFLKEQYTILQSKKYNLRKLFADYWIEEIEKKRSLLKGVAYTRPPFMQVKSPYLHVTSQRLNPSVASPKQFFGNLKTINTALIIGSGNPPLIRAFAKNAKNRSKIYILDQWSQKALDSLASSIISIKKTDKIVPLNIPDEKCKQLFTKLPNLIYFSKDLSAYRLNKNLVYYSKCPLIFGSIELLKESSVILDEYCMTYDKILEINDDHWRIYDENS